MALYAIVYIHLLLNENIFLVAIKVNYLGYVSNIENLVFSYIFIETGLVRCVACKLVDSTYDVYFWHK